VEVKKDSPKTAKDGSVAEKLRETSLRVSSLPGQTKKDEKEKEKDKEKEKEKDKMSHQEEKGDEKADEREERATAKQTEKSDKDSEKKEKDGGEKKEKDDERKFGNLPSAFSIPSLSSFLPTTKRSESMKESKDKERELQRVSSDKIDSARKTDKLSKRESGNATPLSSRDTPEKSSPSTTPPNSTGIATIAAIKEPASGIASASKRDATPPRQKSEASKPSTTATSTTSSAAVSPTTKEPTATTAKATVTTTTAGSATTSHPSAKSSGTTTTTATTLGSNSNPSPTPKQATNATTANSSNAGLSKSGGKSMEEEEEIITLLPAPPRRGQTRSLSVHVTTSKVSHNNYNSAHPNPNSAVSNVINNINTSNSFVVRRSGGGSEEGGEKELKPCCSLSKSQGHNFCRGCGSKLGQQDTAPTR
jgi:hypothetical protein